MRNNFKKILSIVLVLAILFGVVVFAKKSIFKKKNDLINISSLSEEFMDNYFEEVSNVPEEDKENMLIITSKEELKDTYGATKVIEAPNHQYFLLYDSEEEKNSALEKFDDDNSNIEVSENFIRTINEETVLVSSYNSWGVEAMGIDTLLEKLKNKELNDVVVAIIDTGLDVDLFNTYYPGRLAGTYNVLDNNNEMYDNDGHGTHIAGTIAETTPDSVKILPVRTSDTGTFYTSDTIAAINYVTYDKKADVMNMSFRGEGFSLGEYNAVEAAKQKKIISVAAAGNDNKSLDYYPAAFDNTITIAAIDINRDKADFSNWGDSIMFAAPGVDIKSLASNEKDQFKSGTSMATPHVVGAVANLKSMNKNITFNDTITLLRRYSDDIGFIGWDNYFGYGAINFAEAELCDGSDCDEYNVFKSSERDDLDALVDSYEFEPILTEYNYGTITNILGTKIKIRYTNNRLVEYPLYNIKNLEISGYDPYSSNEQTIHVTLKTSLGIEIDDSFVVTNPSSYESVWEYESVGDNNIELTGYKDSEFTGNTLYIPSTIDGYTVTGIADKKISIFEQYWDSFKNVQNLYLPATLTEIGNNAFRHSSLQSGLLYVKSDAPSISVGDYAFMGAQSLMELDANISYVGDYAFCYAVSLFDIRFTNDIFHIGNHAFEGALYNKTVAIPSTVTEFGDEVFYNSFVKNITFMNSFQVVEENMFYNNIYLENVVLPQGVTEIGANAFYGCKKLKSINLTENLTTIGNEAFSGAFDSAVLTIPSSVTSIGNKVFYNSGLKEILFENAITKIPNEMFNRSEKLEKVILPQGVTEIGSEAFLGCRKLKSINIPQGLSLIGKSAFYGAFDSEEDVILELPSSVAYLGTMAFNSTGLREIRVFSNINAIPANMFGNNENLETVTLGEGIEEIGERAFSNCGKLVSVNLPESLTTIGNRAFYYSFDYNSDVKLIIPRGVTTIGSEVFKDIPLSVELYVYSDSVSKTYAHDNNINYVQIDPDVVNVQGINSQYHAFDTIDVSNVSLELTYNEETTRAENITENIEIEYPDSRENLRYGDTSVKLVAYNEAGYKIEKDVLIEVLKLQPEYTVPTGLSANKGQKLSQIELPSGFEWMNGNQVINESGIYKARFVPDDSVNYEVIENIDITLTVSDGENNPYVVNEYNVIGSIISAVAPSTELNSFTSNIILGDGYSIEVESNEVNGKNVVYSGAKVRITHGTELYKEFTISVIGDLNGDGDISVSDCSMIYKYLGQKSEFNDAQAIAANVNGEGGITVSDVSIIYKHLNGKINLGTSN